MTIVGKSLEWISGCLGVPRDWGKIENNCYGHGVPLGDDENVPKLIVVMVVQYYEYTESH